MHMHAAKFGAAMQNRKYFARVKPALGIECAFQALLLTQVSVAELDGHQITLFHADTVFARQHAPYLYAHAQNIRAKFLCPFQFPRRIRVIQYQGMQIAIACMKHIGDAQTVLHR